MLLISNSFGNYNSAIYDAATAAAAVIVDATPNNSVHMGATALPRWFWVIENRDGFWQWQPKYGDVNEKWTRSNEFAAWRFCTEMCECGGISSVRSICVNLPRVIMIISSIGAYIDSSREFNDTRQCWHNSCPFSVKLGFVFFFIIFVQLK